MQQTITIDPVTRLEGHGKIRIELDDAGAVSSAHFQVTQLRGFERFALGRPYYEMPALTARICGICPVAHLLASAKACEEIMAVRIPPAAIRLRQILNLAQLIQSHALSFFHLASPDLVLGMDSDPATRNIFGLAASHPELGRAGITLRRIGQQIIELIAGKRVHPAGIIAGGLTDALTPSRREQILHLLPPADEALKLALATWHELSSRYADEAAHFAHFPSLFLGMIDPRDDSFEITEGSLRLIDASGATLLPTLAPADFSSAIGEAVEPFSFTKFAYYQPLGYPEGLFRVGPLARLNLVASMKTHRADQELVRFKALSSGPVLGSFHYHHARLIEALHAVERMEQLLADPRILDRHVRASAGVNQLEGSAAIEAPRGVLMHHYVVDENGLITSANLVVATGENNLAMNRGILEAARHYLRDGHFTPGALNRIEAVVRCFDPCLSCSTHAEGSLGLTVTLHSASGRLLDQIGR